MRQKIPESKPDYIKTGIVCGCLPTQHGILQEQLYHQILSAEVMQCAGVRLSISSAWYTKLHNGTDVCEKLIEEARPEILLYHVRPDPYLRASKLMMSYRTQSGIKKRRLNFDANDCMAFDRDDNMAEQSVRKEKGKVRAYFRHLNYVLGLLAGSNKNAVKKQAATIESVLALAHKNNIRVFIVGPASRPRSRVEEFLLNRLENTLRTRFQGGQYITCIGSNGATGEPLFFDDGIHVNPAGHRRFAELIFKQLKPHLH